jgi:acetate kinase
MNILIFNCGSSSQGFKLYESSAQAGWHSLASGKAKNVATFTQAGSSLEWKIRESRASETIDLPSHTAAARAILALLKEHALQIDAIGHRFVHGGSLFDRTVRIDDLALADLRKCLPLAPIHNPNSYSVIEVCQEALPDIPQYAVFDTAFHAHMPAEASLYALPAALAEKYGFRKYGFHGLSYQDVTAKTAALMGKPLDSLKLIVCHLGTGGSSVAAVKAGRSQDTSMGYSPLPGLVMSTRCGDIDAEIVLELIRLGYSPDELSRILNTQSGLIGLSGFSSNLEEVIQAAEKGDPHCQAAYDVYAHRLGTYLGSYTWLLGGAHAIVFTDDIGVRSWKLRERVCSGVEALGILLDKAANKNAPPDAPARISQAGSAVQLWVVPNDEESVILKEVLSLMGEPPGQ